jgi:hypothetical protein
MRRQRFALALEQLQPSDWARFEIISSVFLSSEFVKLRTVAAASGDGGRDSELFGPAGDATVMFQYSVSQDWKNKIKKTAKRINEKFDYVTDICYKSDGKRR